MKFAASEPPTDASRRRLLKRAGAVATATGIAGIAGCTAPTSVDEDEAATQKSLTEYKLNESDGPSEPEPPDLAGTSVPRFSRGWIETNMIYQGWYDATLYDDLEWELDSDYFYLRHRGLFNIRVTDPADETSTWPAFYGIQYPTPDNGVFHIEAVGSNAFLTASLPQAQGYEIWITGTLQIEKYWIGLF